MDLLENVATELGFKFHLYLVRDDLYGAKYSTVKNSLMHNSQSSGGGGTGDANDDTNAGQMARESNNYDYVEMDSDWDQSNGIEFRLLSSLSRFSHRPYYDYVQQHPKCQKIPLVIIFNTFSNSVIIGRHFCTLKQQLRTKSTT